MSTMPSFKKMKTDTITAEELNKPEGEHNYLQPGQHDVKITQVENLGEHVTAKTWFKIKIHYEGTGGLKANDLLMVPTDSMKYPTKDGKTTLFMAQKLKRFFAAIGEEFTPDGAPALLEKYIGKGKLVGKPLSLVIGFEGHHAKFVEPGVFQLCNKDGNEVCDKDGNFVAGSSKDELEGYCATQGLKPAFQRFSQVLKYIPVETATSEGDDAKESTEW